jgi:hypothetical protein
VTNQIMQRKHIIAAVIGASFFLLFLSLQGVLRGILVFMQSGEAAANAALAQVFLNDGLKMASIGAALGVCTVMLWDGLRVACAWLRANLTG